MLDGLAGVLWSSEEQSVGASWGSKGELVEGEGLTTGGDDAGTGSSSEAEGCNSDLWNLQQTVVVGDSADNYDGLSINFSLLVADEFVDAREGNWWTVDLGHEKAAEDDFVEARVGSAGQESVELDQEGKIGIFALGGLSVASLLVVFLQIYKPVVLVLCSFD